MNSPEPAYSRCLHGFGGTSVSADELVFDPDERGPQDESLRLHLAALDQLDPDEHASIRALIEGAPLRHQARKFAQTS